MSEHVGHLPGCRVLYPRELLEPGEKLPEGVAEDIGVQVCAEGCPRAEERRQHAIEVARERGWLSDEGWLWGREAEQSGP